MKNSFNNILRLYDRPGFSTSLNRPNKLRRVSGRKNNTLETVIQ